MSSIFEPLKGIIILFITGLIFTSIGAIPLNETINQINYASNITGVSSHTFPIMLMIKTVFQAIGAILIIGAFILIFIWIFGRDEYETQR